MYAAFLRDGTTASVMAAAGVARGTALRYIDRGDPGRNLPSLRERARTAAQERLRKIEEDHTREIEIHSAMARQMLARAVPVARNLVPVVEGAQQPDGTIRVDYAAFARVVQMLRSIFDYGDVSYRAARGTPGPGGLNVTTNVNVAAVSASGAPDTTALRGLLEAFARKHPKLYATNRPTENAERFFIRTPAAACIRGGATQAAGNGPDADEEESLV